jgi:hypothetical protein
MSPTLPRSVCAVEAILAEIILALLTLHDGGFAITLLAHDDARWLSDNVNLILFFPYLLKKFDRLFQILRDTGQFKLLINVRLDSLLDTPE